MNIFKQKIREQQACFEIQFSNPFIILLLNSVPYLIKLIDYNKLKSDFLSVML